MIHTNELPLRHLIERLDGPTTYKSGFSGPIGKTLLKVNEMDYNPDFEPLLGGEEFTDVPESVL